MSGPGADDRGGAARPLSASRRRRVLYYACASQAPELAARAALRPPSRDGGAAQGAGPAAGGTDTAATPAAQAGGGPVVVKHFLAAAPHRRSRAWSRRLLGAVALAGRAGTADDAPTREWRALCALSRAGAPVPRPLARGADARGSWIAMRAIEGIPAPARLAALRARGDAAGRRALVGRIADCVRALHAAGWAHGDLHLGNLLVDPSGAVYAVDLQRAQRIRSRAPAGCRAARDDLAALEFSFAHAGLSRSDRLRLRRAVLGPAATRAALRAAGRRCERVAHDHFRGRTRRAAAPGRRFARVALPHHGGMRVRQLEDDRLAALLHAHEAALAAGDARVIKDDARARVTRHAEQVGGVRGVVVKQVVKGGLARRLADRLRGSPAQRGWRAGYGLQARGIACARPLAWVERGARSWLVVEDLGEDRALPHLLCAADPAGRRTGAEALLALLIALHRRGVVHGDLQIDHVFARSALGADACAGPASASLALIDLEGVRFVRRPGDALRIRALAELNASIPDAWLDAATRCALFERYARALPFSIDPEQALGRVVRLSLARAHAWRGEGCARTRAPATGHEGARARGAAALSDRVP